MAELEDAQTRLAKLLEKAKSLRDNLNKRVLTDEMFERTDSLETLRGHIERVQKELEWTSREARN